jgi:uncharacterized protein (DUF1330 family)
MPKGYWIALIDVHDPETYKLYIETARPAYERFGAKFLARGGKIEAPEGPAHGRNVIIQFNSMADAVACYNSPEYAKARDFRHKASTGEFVIVEGT